MKKDKKPRFSEEALETLRMIAAERKGQLRKIVNQLLRAAHESNAELQFSQEPPGYSAWVDGLGEEEADEKD
jgi:hypothetical protein